ncbi:hypothetical protein LX36DRAFT_356839 [Colletotrichum falcatum]|nr:hypothetical protein LX36DRAFT_356839 [Colletotrichum falcatum]
MPRACMPDVVGAASTEFPLDSFHTAADGAQAVPSLPGEVVSLHREGENACMYSGNGLPVPCIVEFTQVLYLEQDGASNPRWRCLLTEHQHHTYYLPLGSTPTPTPHWWMRRTSDQRVRTAHHHPLAARPTYCGLDFLFCFYSHLILLFYLFLLYSVSFLVADSSTIISYMGWRLDAPSKLEQKGKKSVACLSLFNQWRLVASSVFTAVTPLAPHARPFSISFYLGK